MNNGILINMNYFSNWNTDINKLSNFGRESKQLKIGPTVYTGLHYQIIDALAMSFQIDLSFYYEDYREKAAIKSSLPQHMYISAFHARHFSTSFAPFQTVTVSFHF